MGGKVLSWYMYLKRNLALVKLLNTSAGLLFHMNPHFISGKVAMLTAIVC